MAVAAAAKRRQRRPVPREYLGCAGTPGPGAAARLPGARPDYPFLGVHLTPRVTARRTSAPSGARARQEGNRRRDVSWDELSRLARSRRSVTWRSSTGGPASVRPRVAVAARRSAEPGRTCPAGTRRRDERAGRSARQAVHRDGRRRRLPHPPGRPGDTFATRRHRRPRLRWPSPSTSSPSLSFRWHRKVASPCSLSILRFTFGARKPRTALGPGACRS